jgi:hypothetical protein
MTLSRFVSRFVAKNTFRNKRRSLLTIASIGVSLLLLTFMMTMWRGFYLDKGSAESTRRLVTREFPSLSGNADAFGANGRLAASYAHVTRHLEKGMLLPPG